MAYTDEGIMALVKERGILRYSMLMARFHISSVEAKNIVSDYISKGIVDEDGRYGKKVRVFLETFLSENDCRDQQRIRNSGRSCKGNSADEKKNLGYKNLGHKNPSGSKWTVVIFLIKTAFGLFFSCQISIYHFSCII